MLEIWGRKTSSNVQALMWCVGELGLAYRRHDVGHKYGGNDSPEFRLCPLAWCKSQRSTTVSGRVRPGGQGVVADNLTMAVLLNGAMVSSVMYRAL